MASTELSTARVWRQPGFGKHWKEVEQPQVTLDIDRDECGVALAFELPQEDGEPSSISITLERSHFADLFNTMIRAVDRGARRSRGETT